MKLQDVIEKLTDILEAAKKENKLISFAEVKNVKIEFEDDIDLTLKPKE
jgi:hypothetical protein